VPDRPTLYLTYWGAARSERLRPYLFGPVGAWSIMARPRPWERGMGTVSILAPNRADLDTLRAGNLAPAEYYRRLRGRLMTDMGKVAPGRLHTDASVPIPDGATLCCACGPVLVAQRGCHRQVVAEVLELAGWNVRLDTDRSDWAELTRRER
jgi:hypothetical protein